MAWVVLGLVGRVGAVFCGSRRVLLLGHVRPPEEGNAHTRLLTVRADVRCHVVPPDAGAAAVLGQAMALPYPEEMQRRPTHPPVRRPPPPILLVLPRKNPIPVSEVIGVARS